ncbi:GAF domain-containing protein [Phytophthora infestans]|uniref:GAF domain-containing protein n=1 Tax=Phytophthora infestans TaxID=4787 RepID=A0A833TLN4_PHYIN|nr:GAF domain-containing protein [Phytophthora infestans]
MPFKTSSTSLSSLENPSRKVLVEDDDLLRRVRSSRPAETLKRALTAPTSSWGHRKRLPSIQLGSSDPGVEDFVLSSRIASEGFEVLTIGDIACSPQELTSILCPRDESDYNATMKGLHDDQFIYGSVVHVLNGEEAHLSMPESHQLTVRTGCFLRSRLLARNEQWCTLEYFQPTVDDDSSQGFSISILSLSDKELAAGKVIGDRVTQLDDINGLFIVDSMPASEGANKVRVIFHLRHCGKNKRDGSASTKVVRDRLVSLAQGIPRLPVVVRRRRLGTQVFAHQSAQVEMQNTCCIACTKGLRLSTWIRLARRCQLCAHNVCTSCWTRQSVETCNGRVEEMGVCRRCLEWVDSCNYSHIQVRGPARIVEDPVSQKRRWGQSLHESLTGDATREATMTVVKLLLSPADERNSKAENTDTVKDEDDYMAAVEEYFFRSSERAPAAKDCVLANAQQRTYPLHPMDRSSPSAPIPDNEVARLTCIDRLGLMDMKEPMLELDVISSFISKELGVPCVMITIVGETHVLVLSSSVLEHVQTLLPREQTFCQHLLMGDAPFIIRNPEADIRFHNMNPVTREGAKFYCGIPVVAPNGVVVGSICCIHTAPMDITRSQYYMLKRFGQIASKIIKVKSEVKASR